MPTAEHDEEAMLFARREVERVITINQRRREGERVENYSHG